MGYVGMHLLGELFQCPPDLLDDEAYIKETITEAAERCKATIVGDPFVKRKPDGNLFGAVPIAESHLIINAFPRLGYAAMDIFTCSGKMDYESGMEYVVNRLKPQKHRIIHIARGEGMGTLEPSYR